MGFCQVTRRALLVILANVMLSSLLLGADNSPQVVLNTSKSAPRAVEPLTQHAIVRDYKYAWASLAAAMKANSAASLNGLFVGNANAWVNQRLSGQRRSGITSHYSNQSHKLDTVFYSPEGDVVELHDTAEYDFAILDGGKTIHSEHAIVHYVVLMTPGVDRWVVRQLQAVPKF